MKEHPTEVEGFDGSLQELAQRVCRMRYDSVAAFFFYCAEELLRQANADQSRGRTGLSVLLNRAWGIVHSAQLQLERAFFLCAPHMSQELGDGTPKLPYNDPWVKGPKFVPPVEVMVGKL